MEGSSEPRIWIIIYYCVCHQKDDGLNCTYHYWNEDRGWVDERHEATEYTFDEMRRVQLHIEKVMSTNCRTQLMEADQCDTRVGQEKV